LTTSLYDLSVGCYLQTIGGVAGFLKRGLTHFEATGVDPDKAVGVRLFEDMAPLSFQIVSVAHHSLGAVQGVERGEFSPPTREQPSDYAGLQKLVADAEAALIELDPEHINAFAGKHVVFKAGEHRLTFTAENFILSFSLPNFHFHASTAYDILRTQGVPLGKRNYLGKLRVES
jgi:hypothetical protein